MVSLSRGLIMNYCPNCGHNLKEPVKLKPASISDDDASSWMKLSKTKYYRTYKAHTVYIEHHEFLGYWSAQIYAPNSPIAKHVSELSFISLIHAIDRKLNIEYK